MTQLCCTVYRKAHDVYVGYEILYLLAAKITSSLHDTVHCWNIWSFKVLGTVLLCFALATPLVMVFWNYELVITFILYFTMFIILIPDGEWLQNVSIVF